MHLSLRQWLRVSFFNLLLIALIGIILRYKIAFSLPFIDQKYLLHGHSHFAFAGWISQALMALLIANLSEQRGQNYFIKYRWVLSANLLTAYGMLFTFPFMGYGFLSILFSTLSVFVSYAFAFMLWNDFNKATTRNTSNAWFKLALICNVISSIGPFSLAYMMAIKSIQQNWYLASVYFFLHFQYNGWFFFACIGLLCYQLNKLDIPVHTLNRIYQLFACAFFPALFLSLLWWPIPIWLYAIVIAAAVSQLAGLLLLASTIRHHINEIKKQFSPLSRYLLALCLIAFTIKLFLQAGSVFPALSKLAFGFRPIVIGYLHLVLLGVISIFILGYVLASNYISITKAVKAGVIVFISGILLNETLLMTQGVADINYTGIPFINILLLAAATVMFTGIFILNLGLRHLRK